MDIIKPTLSVRGIIAYAFMFVVNHLFGINKKKYYFEGMGGNYNDNARAVSEKMHELHPDSIIVWGLNRDAINISVVPNYIRIAYKGYSRLFHRATAAGWVSCLVTSNLIYKNPNQLYVQCWHGDRPLKKILKDVCPMYLFESDHCDLITSGSGFYTGIIPHVYGYYGKILETGCPRNDRLVKVEKDQVEVIKKELSLDNDKKVLLYAPTFRDVSINKQKENFNISRVLEVLKEKTGQEWLCIGRFHPAAKHEDGFFNKEIIDVTSYFDMADLLLVSDAIITDYSSSVADYTILKRPVYMYQPDIDVYTSKDRELYFDMKDTPFWVAKNQDELEKLIMEKSDKEAADNCRAIDKLYGTHETGHSSEDVVNFLCNR